MGLPIQGAVGLCIDDNTASENIDKTGRTRTHTCSVPRAGGASAVGQRDEAGARPTKLAEVANVTVTAIGTRPADVTGACTNTRTSLA